MTIYDILIWAPFVLLTFAAVMYVLISLPHWLGEKPRHHHPAE
jgi:hypothetical protein